MATSEHTITVHPAHAADAPVVYLPVVEGDGSDVYTSCRELGCPDHTLVAIGGIDWNRELSPWQCDAITRESEPFGGEAKAFLAELEDAIAPSVEAGLDAKPRTGRSPAIRSPDFLPSGRQRRPAHSHAWQAYPDRFGFRGLSITSNSTVLPNNRSVYTFLLARKSIKLPIA